MNINSKYMQLALDLAKQAKGLTSPNPLVGAVIVRNGKVIATGFHKKAGTEHAEIIALKEAGKKAQGAALYLTLEPCSSLGRTLPCVQEIIKSGIKKVVIAIVDPNWQNKRKGIKILKDNKIEVILGVLKNEAQMINQPFIKYITKGIPYVTFKSAQSLDGKIAARTGDSKWITTSLSRRYSHDLRNNFDAIVVGINTVLKDDPRLNPSSLIKGKKFYKIVLDTSLRINLKARLFKDIGDYPVVVVTDKNSLLRKKRQLRQLVDKGAIVLGIERKGDNLDLKDFLKKIAQLEITHILVEGGGKLAGSFFDEGLIDKVLFFVSPCIIGGLGSVPSVQGRGVDKVKDALQLKQVEIKQLGRDFLIEGIVEEY